MPPVEPAGASAQQPVYTYDPIRLRRLDHSMKMIWHEGEGVALPTGLHARLAQRPDETLSVHFVLEDGFTPATAIQHMVIAPDT